MMVNNKFAQQFIAYSDWRKTLTQSIEQYSSWLKEEELSDAQLEQRLMHLLDRLA